MWIMTNTGFLSIVAHRHLPDDLLVRARRAGEIESIFPNANISRTPDADYLFRAVISRLEVAEVMAQRIQSIDYDNFKDSVYDRKLHDAYFDTWSVMQRYQTENQAYAGISEECLQHVPLPYAHWDQIAHFIDQFSEEIGGYAYGEKHGGHEQFLQGVEETFAESARLPGDIPALLAVISLVFRRSYWLGQGDEKSSRPLVDASLRKIQKLKKPSSWALR